MKLKIEDVQIEDEKILISEEVYTSKEIEKLKEVLGFEIDIFSEFNFDEEKLVLIFSDSWFFALETDVSIKLEKV